MLDGSAQALKRFPETFLTDKHIMNTSLFSRLAASQQRGALGAIRRDHEYGRLHEVIARYESLVREYGDGAVFLAWP